MRRPKVQRLRFGEPPLLAVEPAELVDSEDLVKLVVFLGRVLESECLLLSLDVMIDR
jgi:hypothetical protein